MKPTIPSRYDRLSEGDIDYPALQIRVAEELGLTIISNWFET